MARLRLPSSGLATPTATRDRSSRRTQSDGEPGEVRGSQLSSSLERSTNHQEKAGQDSGEVEDSEMKEFSNTGEVIDLIISN